MGDESPKAGDKPSTDKPADAVEQQQKPAQPARPHGKPRKPRSSAQAGSASQTDPSRAGSTRCKWFKNAPKWLRKWFRKWRRSRGVGLVGILVAAFIGFVCGIAGSQATDFIKRANECSEALSLYMVNLSNDYGPIVEGLHTRDLPKEQKDELRAKYNSGIQLPITVIQSRCPMDARKSEYLDANNVGQWNGKTIQIYNCLQEPRCSRAEAVEGVEKIQDLTLSLIGDANEAALSGLVPQVTYVLGHLW
ncbi:hypothetical protein ABQF33_03080 [Mycolicibacterium sp. XJ2]